MLAENDGPSMVSYATTGATYGIGFFAPFILLTFFMAFVVQEMTVRLGAATHRGHAELIFQRFGPSGAISPWVISYSALADLGHRFQSLSRQAASISGSRPGFRSRSAWHW